jgi:hypothetical protein
MVATGHKLFLVNGRRSNGLVNRMMNYGDDYGERDPLAKHMVASSPEEAIAKVWDAMEKECNQYKVKAQEILNDVRALENAGKHKEAATHLWRATDPLLGRIGLPPSVPKDRERWTASEVTVSGFRITVEPEVSSSTQTP